MNEEWKQEEEKPRVHVNRVDEDGEVRVVEPAAGERRPHALEQHLN